MPDERDEDRDYTRTRRDGDNTALLYALVGLPLLLLLVAVGTGGVMYYRFTRHREAMARDLAVAEATAAGTAQVTPGGRVRAGKEGVEWDHADLLAHLRASGWDVRMTAYRRAGYFYEPDPALEAAVGADPSAAEHWYQLEEPIVMAVITASPKVASGAEGREPGRAWSWGRFVFRGPPAMLAKFKAALGTN